MSRPKIAASSVLTGLMLLSATSVAAHDFVDDSKVTPLMTEALEQIPGKVVKMLIVEYPPGGSTDKHRHPGAYILVYVLEGQLEMQVKGKPVVQLGPGQTYFETPEDIHTVARNLSANESARFLVVFIQDEGQAVLEPAT